MPRTSALECPGCPPLRALTFDVLGLVKVIEGRGKQGGVPKVVDRWGEPDSSKCVLAASMVHAKYDPLLAVARKNGTIEVLNPLNGDVRLSISNVDDTGNRPENDAIAGLHLFARNKVDSGSRSCTLLTCTTNGKATLRAFEDIFSADSASVGSSRTWNVCSSGNILCSKVDGSENYALFGGKGVEVNVWDLNERTKIWTAKSPPKNSLGIFTPTWFTSATFLSKDDHRKFVAGTNSHEVRLYDISAQRRPVISFDFKETPIRAVAEDLDGHTIYVGNGSGDLASFDMRTGKLLGSFLGKCSGSIRSIARHPELPVVASCGLDSYLRLWDVKTRQLLSAIFLKQHLVNVIIDSNFTSEEVANSTRDPSVEAAQTANENEDGDDQHLQPVKRKKSLKEKKVNKKGRKEKNRSNEISAEDCGSKKLKSKKRVKCEVLDDSP
ncbi:Guanine nucleotide-binding protein, beta subunit [Parasponia andersonii]|uniref:Guanine nucleotide-binding protein, beta subunit n=1 Tax=Parasponia andersonii TaxID=3476 RepID=A0A2P5B4B7_PARAD|nr:Guanine nucleotide-binding protein, beta subunit [Parasponia andersonii]